MMEWIRTIGLLFLGWGIGALVNYLGDVLPMTRSFTRPECHSCTHSIPPVDYMFLRSCRQCRARRRLRAWIVEVSAVVIVAILAFIPGVRLGFWPALIVLGYFGVVAIIDIEHHLIMHPVSLVGGIIFGLVGIWLHGWIPTLLGGLAGFAIMLGIYYLGILFARWLVKRQNNDENSEVEALGFGDVVLSGVLGLLLGWPGIIAGLFLAILLGGAVSLIVLVYSLVARKYHSLMAVPYGPFLLAAAILLLFHLVG